MEEYTAVLTRRRDKRERGSRTAGNGGGKCSSETSGRTSTNRKYGTWRPREKPWQDDAPLWEAINGWMSEEGGGFARGRV
jgi:hypothetical protein